MILLVFVLIIAFGIFLLIDFYSYLVTGEVRITRKTWNFIQVITVAVWPILFLLFADLPEKNNCCSNSAVFSPDHRIGIYALIILCIASFLINLFKKGISTPLVELVLNAFLILALILNVILCVHLTTIDNGWLWWIVGNIPIILVLLLTLAKNQKILQQHIEANDMQIDSEIGKLCFKILNLRPFLKYSVLTVLLVPFLLLLSLFLLVFGQKPDSLIRAFTDTYKHGFSQLDYMCRNVQCGGHFLCSVGANGHQKVVKPVRYGERAGNKIICNRQLLISNAFEELLEEKLPKIHTFIRKKYNKIGDKIHRHYSVFNNKIISDIVYLMMKPLEIVFLFVLYTFDKKPENRIAMQYLSKQDKKELKNLDL